MEQTRVIGVGAYSRQTKVLDQTRKGAIEGLVARGFFGPPIRAVAWVSEGWETGEGVGRRFETGPSRVEMSSLHYIM